MPRSLEICYLPPPPLSHDSAGYLCSWRGGSDPSQLLEAGIADIYSSTARGKLGSHSSSSSRWARKKTQNHTEQMKSVHLPHKFLELNSLTGEKWPDERRDTCVVPRGPSSLSPLSLPRPPGSCSHFLGDIVC